MKKIPIVIGFIFIVLCVCFISINKNVNNNQLDKDNKNNLNPPIKIEQLDYSLEKTTNNNGEIMLYIKAKNNSNIDISYLSVSVCDGEKLDTTIEYLQKLKSGKTTDNYYDIKNSKDDRTKIPVKGTNGEYLHEIGEFKIKRISYIYSDNGKDRIITFDNESKKYIFDEY